MTTITKCCDICTTDAPKISFQYCTKCLNDICNSCYEQIKKTSKVCPHCRNSPYTTYCLLKKGSAEQEMDVDQLFRKLRYSLSSYEIFLHKKCPCRTACKHQRCDCHIHNKKYEKKHLLNLQYQFCKFYDEIWRSLNPSQQHKLWSYSHKKDDFRILVERISDYVPTFGTNEVYYECLMDRLSQMM